VTSTTIACGGGSTSILTDAQGASDQVRADAAADAAGSETGTGPDSLPDSASPETAFKEGLSDDLLPACDPGKGCFGDKCTENDLCLSGWCVEHMGDGVCTIACELECPQGWVCRQVTSGPDLVSICVSLQSNLCKPCSTAEGCKGAGDVQDACVDYGPQGSFCGGACEVGSDCPWGFSCKDVLTVDGLSARQCVSDTGECPCTDKSIQLSLWTPCVVSNDFGSCEGKRVCTADGLSACSASTPTEESCNGVDDNCDGDTDEPLEVGGDYVNLCDDGKSCTKDTCAGAEGCLHDDLAEGECMDGDACTIGDHCEAGECVGLPIACDDKNPCTDDSCDGKGGCQNEFNFAPCDDLDPCTVKDECFQGECEGFDVECACTQNSDCAKLDDGDPCNGTLWCDTTDLPYECALVPGSVVECAPPAGPNSFCKKSACDPATGSCVFVPDHDGFACDDGDPCTLGDGCQDGQCVPGAQMTCGDDNACTDDWCQPGVGCVHVDNTAPCSDGNACTAQDHCGDGACLPGPQIVCDDGNPCTTDACDLLVGCVFSAASGDCDDGNECTIGDFCLGGKCTYAAPLLCDDENPCTDDACLPLSGCVSKNNSGACTDGDPCTVNDYCAGGKCISGAAQTCEDGNPCTADLCAPNGTCLHSPIPGKCSDNNVCTAGDHCSQGACVFDSVDNCDDDNVCTADLCDPVVGCTHKVKEQNPCDDGNVCTYGDNCHLGGCIPAGMMACVDGNPCTDDSCDPKTGCQFVPNKAPCDDGNACTLGDACGQAKCLPGSILPCSDDNPCTDDSCDFLSGCVHTNNSNPCDDKNACTTGEVCSAGVCGNGNAINCNDGNVCTTDTCDKAAGCLHQVNNDPCNDGNACTLSDACANGVCSGVVPLDCNDANLCTDDSCDPLSGCLHSPVQDGTGCGADKHCQEGECVPICGVIHGTQSFSLTSSIQDWTVPACVTSVTIEAWGAEGGRNTCCPQTGGKGARMKGTFTLAPGDQLKVVVGGKGQDRCSNEANYAGSGGGGSFVWKNQGKVLLISAGGGGSGTICTSGGAPQYAQGKDGVTGTSGTADSTGVAAGGTNGADGSGGCGGKGWNNVQNDPQGYGSGGLKGGYGGGGEVGIDHGGGGGGGYSGGGGKPYTGFPAGAGGGGGSFNSGASQDNSAGAQPGNGKIVITW